MRRGGRRRTIPWRVLLCAVLTGLAPAGCGGGSSSGGSSSGSSTAASSNSTSTAASTTTSVPVPALLGLSAPKVVRATGTVVAGMHGPNHDPKVGRPWVWEVEALSRSGRPLNGTVLTEFAFNGAVVGRETPPVHRLRDGHMRDTIIYPARSAGVPLELQAVVRTSVGTVTLDWPIRTSR